MAQLPPEQAWQRHTAVKTWIGNILNGIYLVKDGTEPNVLLAGQQKMSRVSLIGVIVAKNDEPPTPTLLLDDGSGRIVVRSFEEQSSISTCNVGEMISLIGRPREFGQEKYIVPEIIKKIEDPSWITLRKIELDAIQKIAPLSSAILEKKRMTTTTAAAAPNVQELIAEEEMITNIPSKEPSKTTNETEVISIEGIQGTPKAKIIDLIRKLDYGNGAEMNEIIKQSEVDNGERIIKNLILQGDIFEVKPGKVKVLE